MIDDYLFDRLDDTQKEKFEEHYFNCPPCFEKMKQTDEMIAVIKTSGDRIFGDVHVPQKGRRPLLEPVLTFLTPRQLAIAAVSAVLVLIIAIGIVPHFKKAPPEFFVNDDLVRGPSITLISPVMDNLDKIPAEFRWQSLGEEIEYKVFLYRQEEMLWSTSTKDNFVTLMETTKSCMVPGEKYSWQVKAFSSEGTLIALSSRVHFNFLRIE